MFYQNKIPELKYRISYWLGKHETSRRLNLEKLIQESAGLSEEKFNRYINARVDEDQDIPGWRLKVFAHYLEVQIQELYNEAAFCNWLVERRNRHRVI